MLWCLYRMVFAWSMLAMMLLRAVLMVSGHTAVANRMSNCRMGLY